MRYSDKKTVAFFEAAQLEHLDKIFRIDAHKLHYIQTGNPQNPTLFFLHGSPGSWDAYKDYLKDSLLLKKFRMIAIDRPGFGFSNFGEAEDLATQSKLIFALVKSLDNKKPIALVGHSMGGPVVVKMATENFTYFEHIFILSGAVDPKAENPENWRAFLVAKPLRYLVPGALRPSNDELWWLKQDLVIMKPNLKNITCDVTIIHGTKDQLVPYSNVGFMKKEFVNAKSINIIVIENANHFIPWSNFEEIRNALNNWKK
jgi:pimeloyl-ACP methyl ester carboxylesterase